ncbi:DNA cytosine methyltransferase [Candidatus Nomurabacteria bacterium]|nr:DNA cytosine methyltransferase [Candidatus Nomurabacteria bacterium]MCB9827909.1 DNA cytosine methyltransferase [Candidatus Nomurabacteria bacterium]
MRENIKLISLFSGCGGTDLGFEGGFTFNSKKYEKLPYDLVWANEINSKACITFKENLKKDIVCDDIWNVDLDTLPDADIVTGGFPCQDFSVAGLRKGFNSKRGLLYLAMLNVVNKVKPRVFVAENVKGLLSMDKGCAIQKIVSDFSQAGSGYKVTTHLLKAPDYGISQTRERVLIVGVRSDINMNFEPPVPTTLDTPVPVSDILRDLEDLAEGDIPNHYWSKAKLYPGRQGNITIDPSKPGPTMRAEHHGNIEFHYNKGRRLSAREAARIQSFPDEFIFYNSTSDAYRQIGNAVPPVLAWHIAKTLLPFF